MKSTCYSKETSTYPGLYIYDATGRIYFMTAPKIGTLVYMPKNDQYPEHLGIHTTQLLVPVRPFAGTVVLEG